MKEIPLSNSTEKVLVDDDDFEYLSNFNWYKEKRGTIRCKVGTVSIPRLLIGKNDVDHKDRNPLNNQRSNFRETTIGLNNANRAKKRGCSSQYKGVVWHSQNKNWRAQISINGKNKSLGSFTDEIKAAKAYDLAAAKQFGEFAVLNFPREER